MKLLLALLLPVAIVPAGVPATEQVVIADGHVDLGPRFVDGKWTIQLRDDTTDPVVWRPLENVVIQASDAAVVSVPADPSYAFLGTPGAKVWVIPQVQQPGVVWPGWNTQDPGIAGRVDREVTWKLNKVDGPGAFTLFLNSDFGKPAPVFDSRKPYPQETGIDINTHVHGNWTFAAPGSYRLDITMTAKLTDGTTVTDTRPLHLHAGPGDPREAFKASPSDAAAESGGKASTADGQRGGAAWPWLGGSAALVAALAATYALIRRRRA